MNQVSEEKKTTLTKVLAILGFLAIIVLAVWLAVKIVSVIPSAFSSLASLADSVYNYDREMKLEVATENSVVNAGEAFTISWTNMRKNGTYTFSYSCIDGVSVDIRDKEGNIEALSCDTPLDLKNATSLEIRVSSEKSRFVDVPYSVTFTENGNEEAVSTGNSTVTIVNATIPTSGIVQEEDSETEEETAAPEPSKTVTTPSTPRYTPGTPIVTKKTIYTMPVSDPNGKIDLQVTFLGVGTISGSTFIKKNSIDIDDQGALQFEVKNIGTKTAEDWDYTAKLPGDITYTSDDQKALKPNERAVITLGFEGLSDDGSEKVSVEVTAKNDVKKSNNEFTQTVKITD